MQNTYPSGPILKAGLEGACPVERCLPIPGFHRNGGMLNFCKVLSQLVSIPLLFIAVICVQSALLAPWRKCHLFTLVLISVFTVLAKTIQFIQLKNFLLQNWLLGRLYFRSSFLGKMLFFYTENKQTGQLIFFTFGHFEPN